MNFHPKVFMCWRDKMKLPLGGSLVAPHASSLSALPVAIRSPCCWISSKPLNAPKFNRRKSPCHHDRQVRWLHPVDSALEGVPSSLFTFRAGSPRRPRRNQSNGDEDGNGPGDYGGNTDGVSLQAGLIEETDLAGVSALLVESFPQGVYLADGDFSELEGVIFGAPIEMTNKYLNAVAYYEIFYALKARCGKRLVKGDFVLTSDALVLAVRTPTDTTEGESRDIVAVVEVDLRQPDGTVPSNWPFRNPWRPKEPQPPWQPYMCNLAVAEDYRGKGFGKQLVRLCEHIVKNQWGYERMYLHVDLDDPAPTTLYNSMGYESMEQYDAPMWMRKLFGLPTIRYQVKHLKKRKSGFVEAAEESERHEAAGLR